ncbi:MAG: 50S ribosomal protein L9 [Clostridia bacterium]|nr:50S ribosomal protein L9 [Clostridia bacterium]
MLVILKEDVKGTGKKGEIVKVSDGYGKNFLIKLNKAVFADNTHLNEVKQKEAAEAFHEAKIKAAAQIECDKVHNKTITVSVKTGENGKVFGSVTSKEIAEEIKKLGVEVDKKKIELSNPIKQTGLYSVNIKFYKGIVAKVKINVISA